MVSLLNILLPKNTDFPTVSISSIEDLESVSRGILNLTSLETLGIFSCIKLSSLPKEGLPVSLQKLDITGCTLLEEQCSKEKGDYWSIISQIPERRIVHLDHDLNACVIQ